MPSRRQVLALSAAGVASLAGCSAIDDSPYDEGTDAESEWPQPAYDGGNSAYARDAAAPRSGVTEGWSVEVPHPSGRPVVAEGLVFIPAVDGLHALDLDSGEERWHYSPEGEEQPWTNGPAVHGGRVVVTHRSGETMAALDAEKGEEVWTLRTEGYGQAPPTLGHGGDPLFVGDHAGVVYAIEETTGRVEATFEAFGAVTTLAAGLGVLVGTEAGEVYSLYLSNDGFRGLWRRKLDGKVTALSANDSVVVAGTFGGPVYRFMDGAHAGRSRWEHDFTANHLANTGYDVVATNLAETATLQYRTGNVEWGTEIGYKAAPAVAGDTVVFGGGDTDGKSYVDAYPVDGGLGLADYRLGNRRWRFETETPPLNGIAVADGSVFAVTGGSKEAPPKAYRLDEA